jgi:pimeloyl-ACP methyl ester carboxylesterase
MDKSTRTAAGVLDAHRNAGQTFTAGGVRSFLRAEGDGEPVVCIHGMLGSSFGYRKVIRELAVRGLRGIAWDLPGFGLTERPRGYDYSWTGLGRFCVAAVNALNIDRFHLVVHDIGGPVGFELAAACPGRVLSLTILNTVVDVTGWTPPWTMRPFRWPIAGELWAAGMVPPAFRFLMKLQGIGDVSQVSKAEINTYRTLMKGDDRGRAFLQVSRSAQATASKQELYRQVVEASHIRCRSSGPLRTPRCQPAHTGRKHEQPPGSPPSTAYPASIFRKKTRHPPSPIAWLPSCFRQRTTPHRTELDILFCRRQGLPGLPWCAGAPVRRACRTGAVSLAVEPGGGVPGRRITARSTRRRKDHHRGTCTALSHAQRS